MATSGSPPPPPPLPQLRSSGGGADLSLFLDTDLGTHLALTVPADSTIRRLKLQVAMEHAAAFPDLGPVAVKSFQVLRKGAMYHLSDSMAVGSAFRKVKAGCFLHVKMTAVEADTHCCRDEDRGRSSEGCLGVDVDTHVRELPATISEIANDVLPQRLEGAKGAIVLYNVHAHDAVPNDVHLSSSSQQNAEQNKNKAVSLASDVHTISVSAIDKPKSHKRRGRHGDQTGGDYVSSTSVANVNVSTDQSKMSLVGEEVDVRKEDPQHSFRDNDLGAVSGSKQVGMKEGTLGKVHSLDDLSQEKEGKKARKTSYFDTSVADPVRESNNPETTVVNKSDRIPLEVNTNSHGVLSSTSFQQEFHGNAQEDSIQLENPIIAGKNKKRKKRQLVNPESVSAQEMTKPLTGAVVAPKTIGEDILHEDNQGLQGDSAYNVKMTSREKTMVKPSDMLLSSSQLSSGSQGIKNVQLVSDAQAISDPVAGQGGIDLIHEWYRNRTVGDTGNSTSKVVASEETSIKGINDGYQGEGAVEANNMEKGSKSDNVLEKIHTAGNSSQQKNCEEAKKVSYVGITSMDTAEKKDQGGYGEKAANSDIISTHAEIVNDPDRQHISSNVQQGDCNVIENPIGDGKRKKKKRRYSESPDGNPTQNATKSSLFIRNANSTQNTSAQPLDAKQTTLGTIGEETGEEKDHCGHGEKAAKPVIVSTQGEIVKNSSSVQQGSSDAIENPNGDRKRKKKRGRHSESSKHDPTQDVTKSSGYITNESLIQNTSADPLNAKKHTIPDTIGEATVSDCKKLDENLSAATTNVINEVLADLKCTDSLSKGLNGDPLTEQTHVGSRQNELGILEYTRDTGRISASIPPKYPAEIHSDAPISSSNHKSNGKQLKVLSTVLDSSHSCGGVPEENANTELRESDLLRYSDSDLKDVLTENTVPADDNIKSTKRQRKKTSLKHVCTDSGKAIQSSVEQVSQVAPEDSKGANATRAELIQGGLAIDAPASAVQKIVKKSKRSSKTHTPKTQGVNHSQFAKDRHDEYVPDNGGTHGNDKAVETPIESLVDLKDGTIFTYDSPNARKGRKKSCKTELRSQHTDLEHVSNADLINSRAQQKTVIPNSSADAVEPNDCVAVHPGKDKINFIDHFGPSGTNGQFESAENSKDETIRQVKGKKKSKRKTKQSQHTGSIEPNDMLQSHLHTDKTSLTDQLGPGNVCVPSDLAENTNRVADNLKKAKEKKKSKRKTDLVKPESQNPNGTHQDTENCTPNSLYSVVQQERNEQGNGKGNNGEVTQNSSMLQQKIDDATYNSTPEKKPHESMFDAGIQNNLAIDKDHARMGEEQMNSISQAKHHVKSRKHDDSISGRTSPNPNAVRNLVKSFSMSPPASSQSAERISQNGNRYRVAVRKVPRKGHDQVSEKSKKDSSKRGTSAIFSDDMSEGSDDVLNTMSKKTAMEASSDDSSTSADSGISSAARYGSDVPDDDGIVSLSQRSLHIGSILRGSSSYKKARLKQTEQLDDTEIPDSLPPDSLQD